MPMFLYHYMFISEYLWNVIEPNDNATSFSILDMTGVGMSDFMGDVKLTVMEIMKLTKAHYPSRSFQIIVVNAPWSFNAIWSLAQKFMDPATRKKTHVYGKLKT